eukprot:TRINITY_DN3035_c0_g1_i1.p1 TRINITY_DN3035_c0_g1~~TRINITY_DN3035_c0_g1_i1.p1  ORF type:complete len:152 (-),score=17.30 TRINITY_DN3035_c0_g1_i1:52-507(-)
MKFTALTIVFLCVAAAQAGKNWLSWLDDENALVMTFYPETVTCQEWGELPPCNPWDKEETEADGGPQCTLTKDGRICKLTFPVVDEEKRQADPIQGPWTCYKTKDCKYKNTYRCPCPYCTTTCYTDINYDPPIAHCGCTYDGCYCVGQTEF